MESLRKTLKEKGSVAIVVVLFDDYELLDVYGPAELLAGCNVLPAAKGQVKLRFVANGGLARPTNGPATLAEPLDDDTKSECDVLLVPGGMGTRKLQHDQGFLQQLRVLAAEATLVLSVCTGSLLLAAAGLLDGKVATTNKRAFIDIAENWPKVKWQRTARWCTDGKFYSSSGVAAGIDLTHFFLKELFGEKVAKMTAKCAEYVHNDDPGEDPFVHSKTFDLKNPFGKPLQLVVVVYDQFEMWDTFGPLEMFSMANRLLQRNGQAPAFEVKVVAEDFETKSFGGPWFQCEALASGAEGDIDLLLLPGGIGTLREIYNPVFSKAICAMVAKAQRVMTVCTGSAILASQNLLQNRKVTTNKMSFDLMALFGPADWVPSARWVRDEKFWTSSGVSAGTDLSLALMREVFGADLAEAAAEATEYVWSKDDDGSKDPFAESIPEQTLGHRLVTRIQKAAVGLVFCFGFTLKYKMQITSKLI